MYTIVGIQFRGGGKIYYFEAASFELPQLEQVVVETERGLAVGSVAIPPREVEELPNDIPLKPLIRIATPEDREKDEENKKKEGEARSFCQECIEKHQLDMRLVDVEHLFDGSKIIFYFTADERVDFRGLVRDLAAKYRTRIEMRQIGVRNKAKLVGGIGSCGRELCCVSFLNNFEPVSVKMAKDQNISLNPSKISGVCGRLMCCLKFEHDTYLDMKREMPWIGKKVDTEKGKGKIIRQNVLSYKVTVELEDGTEIEIPVTSLIGS
jgi:cell fate regulator YaaT (PSP1 superfamily)